MKIKKLHIYRRALYMGQGRRTRGNFANKKRDENNIDFTTRTPNKTLHLIECPDCGRTGYLTEYKSGEAAVKHKAHTEMGLTNWDDLCFFKNGIKRG